MKHSKQMQKVSDKNLRGADRKETQKLALLNPKIDFVFKKIFGSEENKDILLSFINAILDREPAIKSIEIKNPYNFSSYINGKMSILDIKAVDNAGTWYDIEMQLCPQLSYYKRALYYWAKVYSDNLESGEDFASLPKTIGINILDFNCLSEADYHNEFGIFNKKSFAPLTDVLELHFIETSKFMKEFKDIRTALDRWIAFLNRAYQFDRDTIPQELESDAALCKAVEKLDNYFFTKDERELYESMRKSTLIRKDEINFAKREGRILGREEGIAEVASRMLKDGLSLEIIKQYTGLSEDEIKTLK